jgi:hypothetical protein
MAVAVRAQYVMALTERIEVEHFVCAVLVLLLDATGKNKGVVVRRRVAQVQAEKQRLGDPSSRY